ncbi:MAG: hypothetical protein WKG06_22310 [Segetibacter sp.]
MLGQSDNNDGVRGFSKHQDRSGVVGTNTGSGMGVSAQSTAGIGLAAKGGKLAAFFDGDIEVTGDIRLTNADFAEDFTVKDQTEPGEVMVLTEDGTLTQSTKAYDKKVVGVLSGAGSFKPGIILDKQSNNANRKPIAMMGKVFCKVDADMLSY